MIDWIISAPAGAAVRIAQAILQGGLYLVIGFLVAGFLRAFLGAAGIRRLFGEGSKTGPLRAFVIGLLLPTNAIGLLPILDEVHRAGVRHGPLLALAVSGAVFHPISLAYGLSLLGPFLMLVLVLAVGAVTLTLAWITPRLRLDEQERLPDPDLGSVPSTGTTRLQAALVHAATAIVGPLRRDLVVALAGAGLLGAFLSPEFLPERLSSRHVDYLPAMLAVGLPAQIMPERAVRTAYEMRNLNMAPGAIFLLFATGVGLSLGHLSWLARHFGPRGAWRVAGSALCLLILAAIAVNAAVPARGAEDLDTHSFDEYASPFWFAAATPRLFSGALNRVAVVAPAAWPAALALLASLVVAGIALRFVGPRGRFESYLVETQTSLEEAPSITSTSAQPVWSRPISSRALAVVALVVSLVLTGFAAYAYYPSPQAVFQEIQITNANLFSELGAKSPEPALHHLSLFRAQVEKLPTGTLLRRGRLQPDERSATEELHRALDSLEASIRAPDRSPDRSRALYRQVTEAYQRCRAAYDLGD